jgi:hypothetical protein
MTQTFVLIGLLAIGNALERVWKRGWRIRPINITPHRYESLCEAPNGMQH